MLEQLIEWDRALFSSLNALGDPVWDWFWIGLSAKYTMIPLYIFLCFLLYKRFGKEAWKPFLFTVLLLILCDRISVECFKEVFQRLRPSHDPILMDNIRLLEGKGGLYSFVSSHSTNVFGMSMWFVLLLKSHYKPITWLFLWASLVAVSRIFVGKHFPLDIIGGFFLGLLLAYMVFWLWKWFLKSKFAGNLAQFKSSESIV